LTRHPGPVKAGALDALDQQVDRFGRPVGDPIGVEVGQQLLAPGVDRSGQAVQLGDVGVGAVAEPPVELVFGLCPSRAAVDET
jgi:hypothetical protein